MLSFLNSNLDTADAIPQAATHLNLHLNNLKSIPLHLTNLVYLDISSNQLTIMNGIDQLHNLIYLNVSNNSIDEIVLTPKLIALVVSFNRISSLKSIRNFKNCSLSSLDIRGNPLEIENINDLMHLSKLRDLCCDFAVFDRFPNLNTLNFCDRLNRPVSETGFDLFYVPAVSIKPRSRPGSRLENINLQSKQEPVNDDLLQNKLEQRLFELETKLNNSRIPVDRFQDHLVALNGQISTLVNAMTKPKEPVIIQDSTRIEKLEEKIKELSQSVHDQKKQVQENPQLQPSPPKKIIVEKPANSDDEFISIPTKIPRGKNKSLVWIEEKKKPAVIANQKLINALEMEEKRLREAEERYLEKIHSLTNELKRREDTHEKFVLASRKLVELSKTLNEVHLENQKFREEVKNLEFQSRSVSEENVKLKEGQAEIKNKLDSTNKELELVRKDKENLQDQIRDFSHLKETLKETQEECILLKSQLENVQRESSKISSKLFKERESARSKFENETLKFEKLQNALEKSKQENLLLNNRIDAILNEHRQKMQQTEQTHQLEIGQHVQKALEKVSEQHQKTIANLEESTVSWQKRYKELEGEYLDHLKAVRKTQQESNDRLADQISRETILKKDLDASLKKQDEQTLIIGDMVKLVKQQKSKIAELELNFGKQQQVSNQQSRKQELKIKELQAEKQKLLSDQTNSIQLESEYKSLAARLKSVEKETMQQENLKNEKISNLEKQITTLLTKNEKLQANCEQAKNFEETIRIKNQMLDDQNKTIYELKQSLDKKVKAAKELEQELKDCRDIVDELRIVDRQDLEELQDQLKDAEASVDHYKKLAQEYKSERDETRKQVEKLDQKLAERNASISKIEAEVEKISQHHAIKLRDLEHSNQEKIQALKLEFSNEQSQVDFYKREKNILISRIQSLQNQVQEKQDQYQQIERDVRILVAELERQKRQSNEKFARLKQALE